MKRMLSYRPGSFGATLAVLLFVGAVVAMPIISLANDLPIAAHPLEGIPLGSAGVHVIAAGADPAADPIANEVIGCDSCVQAPQASVALWEQCPVGGSPLCSTQWFVSGVCSSALNGNSAMPYCRVAEGQFNSQGVVPPVPSPVITLDGVTLSQDVYRSKAWSIARAVDPTTDYHLVLEGAAAEQVLDRLLFVESQRDGLAASFADGQAIATTMLHEYEAQATKDPTVPKSDPQGFFLSADRIHGYQIAETIRRERDRVLAGVDRSNSAAVRGALSAWMGSVLVHHTLTMVGGDLLAGTSLPDALP